MDILVRVVSIELVDMIVDTVCVGLVTVTDVVLMAVGAASDVPECAVTPIQEQALEYSVP
jgi:hypothetical protein